MSGPGRIRQQAQAGDWGHSGLNFWDNDYDALKQIVRSMKPGEVEDAGTAYTEMSTRMKTSYDLIRRQAGALAEAWGGDPADQALTKMRKLHDAAYEIHTKSSETGAALTGHAATQRKWQSTVKDEHWYGVEVGTGDTGVGDWLQGESHMGRELMQQLQQDTVKSNEKFPAVLQADAPEPNLMNFAPTGGGGQGAGGGGPGTGGAGSWPGGGGLPSSPSSGSTGSDGFPGGSGSDASGADGQLIGGSTTGSGPGSLGGTGGGSTGDSLPGSVIGGGDTSLAGLGPSAGGTPGLGTGPLGAGGGIGSGGLGAGAGGGAFTGPGANLGAAGGIGAAGGLIGGSGTSGRAPGRGGMMPMAPQSGQGDEKERERSTWLVEDEDVWNPGDGTTPPVIG